MKHQVQQASDNKANIDPFHFAILLDDEGHEIAITEEMIQQACAELAQRCHFPSRQAA